MAARIRPAGRVPRKHDKTGRSTGPIDSRYRPKNQPRECGVEVWAWLPIELMDSPAWAALGANTVRLIHRLMIEHAQQGGAENGRLVCTHDDLLRYGLTADTVRESIEEAQAFGIVRVMRQGGRWGGSNRTSLYRLTWLGWWDGEGVAREPTNEWRGVTDQLIESFKAERRRRRAAVRKRRAARREKSFETPESRSVVPLNEGVPGRFRR